VARARALAGEEGVADRVRFEVRDASAGLPADYDLVTTFDVVHDATDPMGLLRSIRGVLRPDGAYLCLEINASERLEENAGPKGAFLHACSVLFCLTVSLAAGGEGLGTLGLHEGRLRELAEQAGFGRLRLVPLEDPFNNLYEIRPGIGGV
jgi:SAM-dependent methyltransferase